MGPDQPGISDLVAINAQAPMAVSARIVVAANSQIQTALAAAVGCSLCEDATPAVEMTRPG